MGDVTGHPMAQRDMIHQSNDLAQAVRYLKLTLPEMSKREIPTTPENYAVWYEYTVGTNHELKQSIDTLIKDNMRFSEHVNNDLFQKFIGSGQQSAVDEIRESVRQVINDLLSQISVEGDGLGDYAKTLESFSEKIIDTSDSSAVNLLITELLVETKKREDATHNLQSSLDKMAQEMTLLRQEVAKLNDEASTDALTRVSNRRAYDIAIERAVSSSKINSTRLSLLMLDIDHFKGFNDQFGHVVGDKVLRFVASMLQKHVKGNDTVARFGGEEFAVILPETAYNDALKVAENVRKRISAQVLSDSAENIKLGSVNVSIGVALYRYGESPEEFMHRADKYMYQAKKNGRNMVIGEEDCEESAKSHQQVI